MASKRKGSGPVESAVRPSVSTPAGGQESVVSNSMSLDVDALRQIIEMLEASEVTSLSWRRGQERLEIRRGPPPMPAMPAAPVGPGVTAVPLASPTPAASAFAVSAPPPAASPAAAAAGAKSSTAAAGTLVTSPFVGTFYRTPAPEQPAFVDVGSVVKKGQVLCIIEAMKLMNEIEAEVGGRVMEILAKNGQPVEFGQALFRIEPI